MKTSKFFKNTRRPSNDYEAYNVALRLAITAPTEKLSEECTQMAEAIGCKLPESFKTKCRQTIEQELAQCK
tara:strand:- start:74 stop:286 length:213 start_codon:yes stop_codon:yes gene_type:complete